MARAEAQRRANQIRGFREELAEVERELGAVLSDEARERLSAHHEALLGRLALEWDVDRTEGQQQLSLGMRVASLVGAVALSAAVFLYFYRIWGLIPTWVQLLIVTTLPVKAIWLTDFAARRERTQYFATIAAVLASASFGLTIAVVGGVFNLPPSPLALVTWGSVTLVLGLGYRFPLLTLAGTLVLGSGLGGLALSMLGMGWLPDNGRLERFLLAGAAAVALPTLWPGVARRVAAEGTDLVRVGGILLAALAVILLSSDGRLSVLPFRRGITEGLYDLFGFAAGAGLLWVALRNRWTWSARATGAFLVLFTYIKAFDWWWELVPDYLFFLILGLIAVAALLVLRQVRQTVQADRETRAS